MKPSLKPWIWLVVGVFLLYRVLTVPMEYSGTGNQNMDQLVSIAAKGFLLFLSAYFLKGWWDSK